MFDAVLVANRGEIARRVIRSVRAVGARAIAVHSEADADALHVKDSDISVLLGPAPPAESYLRADRVLRAALDTGAQAIHPGYGFLSENADFADQVLAAGLTWVGPSPEAIRRMGDKINARNLVATKGVPVAPGTPDPLMDVEAAVRTAAQLGYPLMVKASGGGGGIGMGIARDETSLRAAFGTARSRAERFFGSPAILLERYVPDARHVEVQVLGLPDGRIVALGERDCSVQRRHQKVVEETPSPAVAPALRQQLFAAAISAARSVNYRGAGTVEFLLDPRSQQFYFLEMNTRLQVEHPVTELVTGLDLVVEQLRVAAGEPPGFDPDHPPQPHGHAIELRIYAEDPVRFLPSPGPITTWTEPAGPGLRLDAGYTQGDLVTPYYDPLLAKLCAHGDDRIQAIDRLDRAVDSFVIDGCKTNLPFLRELLRHPDFRSGDYHTGLIPSMRG